MGDFARLERERKRRGRLSKRERERGNERKRTTRRIEIKNTVAKKDEKTEERADNNSTQDRQKRGFKKKCTLHWKRIQEGG